MIRRWPGARDVRLTLIAAACTFLNVAALMTVAPLVVGRASGEPRQAGAVTALFSGATVVAELLMPGLLARFSPGRLLAAALAVSATAALGHLPVGSSAPGMLALAPVRGLGFGVAVVAASVLVAELAPVDQRGRAIGNLGLAIGIPSLLAPSVGLLLLATAGAAWVFGIAGVVALGGALAARRVGPGRPAPAAAAVPLQRALGRRELLVPVLALGLVTATYGGLVSFAPLALPPSSWSSAAGFFLIYGAARAVARWAGGRASDQFGHRAVLIPGLAGAVIGLTALTTAPEPGRLLAAATLAGAGSGLAQTASFIGMLERVPRSEIRLVSSLWNIAFDGGVSLGGAALGLVAASAGYEGVFKCLPAFAAVALALFAFGWPRGAVPDGEASPLAARD